MTKLKSWCTVYNAHILITTTINSRLFNGWETEILYSKFWSGVTFARGDTFERKLFCKQGHFCKKGHFCMASLLHGVTYCTMLHLYGDIFAKRHFCKGLCFTETLYCENFKQSDNFDASTFYFLKHKFKKNI